MESELLTCPDFRERIAAAAYYRERADEAAREQEHELEPHAYFCLAWEDLSSLSKKPYRSGVNAAFDAVLSRLNAS